jgi:hypothetical protein
MSNHLCEEEEGRAGTTPSGKAGIGRRRKRGSIRGCVVKKYFQIWDQQTLRPECATIFHRKELGWSSHSRNLFEPKGVTTMEAQDLPASGVAKAPVRGCGNE